MLFKSLALPRIIWPGVTTRMAVRSSFIIVIFPKTHRDKGTSPQQLFKISISLKSNNPTSVYALPVKPIDKNTSL
jgi:hypothetical protein